MGLDIPKPNELPKLRGVQQSKQEMPEGIRNQKPEVKASAQKSKKTSRSLMPKSLEEKMKILNERKKSEDKLLELSSGSKLDVNNLKPKAAESLLNGFPTFLKKDGEYIKTESFNSFITKNFPNVKAVEVSKYIKKEDAVKLLSGYIVEQQTYNASQKKAGLQEASGQDKAPDMGI